MKKIIKYFFIATLAFTVLAIIWPGNGPSPSKETSPLKAEEIFDLQKSGDPIALKICQQYCDHLINFCLDLCALYDPDLIIFGGGVSNQDSLYQEINESLKTRAFLKNKGYLVKKNELGDSSGVFGAALLAFGS